VALFLMETSRLGRKEGALGDAPLCSGHVISIIQMVPRPERAAQYGVYRKPHRVHDVPLAYSAPDSMQNGQGIQEQSSFPWVVINSRS
jgi:hypothetical protein